MTVHRGPRWSELSDKDRQKILSLSDCGVTAKDIATRFGIGVTSVMQYLRAHGRTKRRPGRI